MLAYSQLKMAGTGRRAGADDKVFPLSNTENYLAMTDLLASGETSWLQLWEEGKMALVPGVGRWDHSRSHFEVKDAAAKGVSIQKEPDTMNGEMLSDACMYISLVGILSK